MGKGIIEDRRMGIDRLERMQDKINGTKIKPRKDRRKKNKARKKDS